MLSTTTLNKDWRVKFNNFEEKILPLDLVNRFPGDAIGSVVPGCVMNDLHRAGLIDDPYFDDNEKRLEWVSRASWSYEREFHFDTSELAARVHLCFDSIDTIGKVILNGKTLGTTDNMFLPVSYDVTGMLRHGTNHIEVIVNSALEFTDAMMQKHGKLFGFFGGGRAYLRKPQYSFGWDWGPAFPAAGITGNVYLLEDDGVRIDTLHFSTVDVKSGNATVMAGALLDGTAEGTTCRISLEKGRKKFEADVKPVNGSRAITQMVVEDPELWYPNGQGSQPLYELRVQLMDASGTLVDEQVKRVGIRTIELQTELEDGTKTFRFAVNGKPIYAKGVDLIPLDSFFGRTPATRFDYLLKAVTEGNMNIVRIWGGGYYESDYFYELCDRLGLLVWQDFMFACSDYPATPEFVQSVEQEAVSQVKRLQHHPSMALWCGNNENEYLWEQDGPGDYSSMQGIRIWSELLPSIVKQYDPHRLYRQSSPFGGDYPNDPNEGNRHEWDIWAHWKDYEQVTEMNSLFVSEFGFQSPPNRATMEHTLSPRHWRTQDEVFEYHNKMGEGPERLLRYVAGHLPLSMEWKDYFYLTQLSQSLALKIMLEHWRFNGITNGAMIWQLHDTYPVASWSLIDWELKTKPAYYWVKNSFAPAAVMIHKAEDFSLRVSNHAPDEFRGRVVVHLLKQGDAEAAEVYDNAVTMPGHSLDSIPLMADTEGTFVLIATLYDSDNNQLQRTFYSSARWKHMRLPAAEYSLAYKDEAREVLIIKAETPLFFVDLHHEAIETGNRGFIMLPGEEMTVPVCAPAGNLPDKKDIEMHCLNTYLSGGQA